MYESVLLDSSNTVAKSIVDFISFFTLKDLNYLKKCKKCAQLKQERIDVPETVSGFTAFDNNEMSTCRKEQSKQTKVGNSQGACLFTKIKIHLKIKVISLHRSTRRN